MQEGLLKKWLNIFHYAKCGIGIENAAGMIEMVNPTFAAMHGYKAEELIGMPLVNLLGAETRSGWPKVSEMGHKQNCFEAESLNIRKDGSLFPVFIQTITIWEKEESPYRVIYIDDVTRQSSICEQLAEREERFRGIVERSSNGIGICNEDGVLIKWNKSMEKITGLNEAEVLGQYVWDVNYTLLPKSRQNDKEYVRIKNLILKVLKEGKIPEDISGKQIEFINVHGEIKIIQNLSFVISTRMGHELVVICRDITVEKNLENEIIRQNEELKKIDRIKSQFLNNISHELRTPLTCLNVYYEILKESLKDKADDRQLFCLREIEHNVRRLLTEVESLLKLSRVENGLFIIRPQLTDVKEQIQSVINDMRPLLEQKNARLIQNIGDIPKIDLDPAAFRHIITNLLNNAIKNTPAYGAITLHAEYKTQKLYCSISDQGAGIDPGNLANVFENYYYAPQKDAVEVGGTGLGLSLCKQLVTMLGGEIWAENNPDKGCCFYLII